LKLKAVFEKLIYVFLGLWYEKREVQKYLPIFPYWYADRNCQKFSVRVEV